MEESNTLTVFAAEGTAPGGEGGREAWRYYSLETGKRVQVDDEEAANSVAWTLAFKRSMIKVNSTASILGGLISEPFDVNREEFVKLADGDFKKRFDAIDNIGEEVKLVEEGIDPALFGWRIFENGNWVSPVAKGWKVRCADGLSFLKMRVREVSDDGLKIKMSYAFQPEKDGPLEEEREAYLSAGESFSFRSCQVVVPDGLNWDIKFDSGTEKIYCNGGASGDGAAGVLGSNKYGAKWSSLDNPSDCLVFFLDEYGSIFRTPKWYRYNIDGEHNLHPNGAVYGIRASEGDYKIQVTDYFEHKGSDIGNFKIRYSRL